MRKYLPILATAVVLLVAFAVILIVGNNNKSATQSTVQDQQNAQTNTAAQATWCITPPDQSQKCYPPVQFTVGDSAYDTFVALVALNSDVTYESTDYGPEMGQFITSVNGTAGTADYFWKLYVNGEGSMQGISQVKPADGDQLGLVWEQVIY